VAAFPFFCTFLACDLPVPQLPRLKGDTYASFWGCWESYVSAWMWGFWNRAWHIRFCVRCNLHLICLDCLLAFRKNFCWLGQAWSLVRTLSYYSFPVSAIESRKNFFPWSLRGWGTLFPRCSSTPVCMLFLNLFMSFLGYFLVLKRFRCAHKFTVLVYSLKFLQRVSLCNYPSLFPQLLANTDHLSVFIVLLLIPEMSYYWNLILFDILFCNPCQIFPK
jgi:hypothetical protein